MICWTDSNGKKHKLTPHSYPHLTYILYFFKIYFPIWELYITFVYTFYCEDNFKENFARILGKAF